MKRDNSKGSDNNGTESKDAKIDLGLLEEDDEFEEFPAEEWQTEGDEKDHSIWEDNWDDDEIENDFSQQLKNELEKQNIKMNP